jgi:hypothetical protein
MNKSQLINISNEIWLSMNELPTLIPSYMLCLNLNPSLIYNDETRTQSVIKRELKEYVESYSDIISVVRILKEKLSK